LRDQARLGLRWPTIGGDALTGIEAAGPVAEGVRVSSAYLPDRPDERQCRLRGGVRPGVRSQRPDHRGAGAYDIVQMLATRVFPAAGTDRRAVRDYLARIGARVARVRGRDRRNSRSTPTATSPRSSVVIGVVRGGRIVAEAAAQ